MEEIKDSGKEKIKEDTLDEISKNASLTSETDKKEDINNEEDFSVLYEESLKHLKEGEVVEGTVIQITKDFVMVDIGFKSDGQIDINEFKRGGDGELNIKVGDSVHVFLEKTEDENGMVVLSKEKADQLKIWDEIAKSCEENEVVEGKIISRIKGGFTVDIGVPAFLPGSQVDLHPIKDMDSLISKTFKFKVLKFNKRKGNIVLSRRAILETERQSLRTKTLRAISEGQIVQGIIKNITDYGLFIDLGGIDGLLHITDLSWGRITHPSEMFSIGDEIEVKILSIDRENERVSLGLKQINPDPWEEALEKYPVGNQVEGKVVSITNYGIFIELEKGIEGLIHISEMSWTKKIKHPSQLISMDDNVKAVVLDIDVSKKRISLGIKQLETNPWTLVEEKYKIGTRVNGQIKNITDFGVFVGIEEGIDGLVHISDISWTQRIKHPAEIYHRGDMIEAVVLNIDKENERFSLGIKQLHPDPWDNVEEKYKMGHKVNGVVTNITDFGIFLELEEGIEGLIHIKEVSKEKVNKLDVFAKEGDTLSAMVINIDRKDRKIGLSIKSLKESQEKEDLRAYNENKEDKPTVSVMKKAIEEGLDKKEKKIKSEKTEIQETQE
ncbi:MAG: 30S ribosomal protein S1 [Thermodesulfobacteriota bacterium]|nr:30S ribosomal protein S1 [Thermodesulfobacteriota bacterium]